MKIVLVSFADSRYKNSFLRLKEQIKGFPFDKLYFLTEKNCLTKEYWRNLKPWLYRRGYGYWSWKFPVVKEILGKLSYGDILFYSDAGVSWNNSDKAIARFNEYVAMLSGSNDILVFDYPAREEIWTKGDVLEALGVYNDERICKSNQVAGGFFCIKKTQRIEKLVDKLIVLCDIQRELVTDKKSIKCNKPEFIETRHDQSIFSVAVKQYPHILLHYNKIYELNDDGTTNEDCPLQIIRHKEAERSMGTVIWNKLLRPWRMILNVYFREFRNYEFGGKGYPW